MSGRRHDHSESQRLVQILQGGGLWESQRSRVGIVQGGNFNSAEHIDGFIAQAPPGWHVHRLSGDRRNEWSVLVSGNWRITFEESGGRISRLNLEDYH